MCCQLFLHCLGCKNSFFGGFSRISTANPLVFCKMAQNSCHFFTCAARPEANAPKARLRHRECRDAPRGAARRGGAEGGVAVQAASAASVAQRATPFLQAKKLCQSRAFLTSRLSSNKYSSYRYSVSLRYMYLCDHTTRGICRNTPTCSAQ